MNEPVGGSYRRDVELDRQAIEALAGSLGSMATKDHPLGALTTYRVGGTAALAVTVDSRADLVSVHHAIVHAQARIPVLVMGKGSNLLVADTGFQGLLVILGKELSAIDIEDTAVRGGGGAGLPVLARRSASAGLHGLEWAVGVPGSVGGAIKMNAGGHGSDTASVLDRCSVFDLISGRDYEASASDLHLSYRSSSLRASDVVLWAEFRLARGDRSTAEAKVAEVVRWRREHQPGGSNAGSVFTNPPGDSAGRLIDSAGLKGVRVGTACVSPKHANFIQADEGGSADDVARLMAYVQRCVAERLGVELEPEVRMIGFEGAGGKKGEQSQNPNPQPQVQSHSSGSG
ncbi:MAG TPA: UDP-N-acetylmuramate dehydrogenase [Acidimicrobiales bacterium]|nr:UDP-N-acetylmuramate dehydrogenase [Acidimicrobiales bacterium]